jgi:hypothetical protein
MKQTSLKQGQPPATHLKRVTNKQRQQCDGHLEHRILVEHQRSKRNHKLSRQHNDDPVPILRFEVIVQPEHETTVSIDALASLTHNPPDTYLWNIFRKS